MPMVTPNLAKASRSLHIKTGNVASNQMMGNRLRRINYTARRVLLDRGLVALLLPLGLLFLAFVTRG
jgi:hypothetical protein